MIRQILSDTLYFFSCYEWEAFGITYIEALCLNVPIIIILIEIIIRSKPPSKSSFYDFWSVVDKLRIGAVYAIILEAFKLGS